MDPARLVRLPLAILAVAALACLVAAPAASLSVARSAPHATRLAPGPAPARAQSDDGTWSTLSDPGAPGARREFAAVYDPVGRRYIVFAGFTNTSVDYQLFNEVWLLSLEGTPSWTHLAISGALPGERHSPQWGFDPANQRLIIFGGYGSHTPGDPYAYLDDVWQLSLAGTPAWTELHPLGTAPSGRLAGAAVYDPFRERFVGFGGTVGVPVDTWVLDLTGTPQWETLEADSTGPPGGYGMTSIYDPIRDRMVIFGGSTSDAYFGVRNDTWELDLHDRPTWRKLNPAGPLPAARRSGTAIYDPLRDRMLIYAGWDSGPDLSDFLGDVWAESFGLSPAWTQLAPAGTNPTGRDAMSAIYDPFGDRMVVFGGGYGSTMLGDTDFLSFGGEGAAASFASSASSSPALVSVDWDVQNTTGTLAAVYRTANGADWTSVAIVQTDNAGVAHYHDNAVTPGSQYGYQLVVPTQLGEAFGGQTWVTVPTSDVPPGGSLSFALDPVAPNPAVGRFHASFTLPSADPARLELIDVAGRRIAAREVGSLGPGRHEIALADARQLAAGIYFVRLTQGGRVATRRVAVEGR